ncbi:hypothetical protein HJG54_17595 [Leptolyngbya sp. NK1-12]|uniref:Uncharacterized protein n=1 Tax=Leptolyngbya sp. NK1-12 TaxID=2547451 RepID=A0AA96WG85_9CYAN|nr:hypothetical protein [Leptolyngbya sp. NK1-12]WNZ24489.1 hypothetical protein HJG54_17595 [Leptolyngbya sp. NK1-12]
MLSKRLYATLFPGLVSDSVSDSVSGLAFRSWPSSRQQLRFWLGASLLVAVGYGIWGCQTAWWGQYVVQDDARQHLFWLRRFLDPELFPQDLIADYFQSVAPWGYTLFYRMFAAVGIDPIWLGKGLPLVLGVLATLYGFRVCMQLLPIPFTGFLAAVLLNQVFWSHDDLASATPRAFMPLFFLAFLDYLMRRALWPCLVTIGLEGLFYPQYVLVFAGILCLQPLRWQNGLRLTQSRQEYRFCLAGLLTALLVLLPYGLITSPYGPVITAAVAKQLPDFAPDGRGRFFLSDPWMFWLSGNRSGIFPTLKPPLLGLGLLLPVMLGLAHLSKFMRQQLRPTRHITANLRVLVHIVVVALMLFGVAHLLLFYLHLPSRYTAYTLRLVLVFATAINLTLCLEAGLRWLQQYQQYPASWPRQMLVWGLILGFGGLLWLYPTYAENFPHTGYRTGTAKALYQFLAQQPKDSLVASLLKEADNLPTFAQRSVFVAPEYAVPYHIGYATQFRQRAIDLIQAQYTSDLATLRWFIETSGVDFWLVDANSFNPAALPQWIRQYPRALQAALDNLKHAPPLVQQRLNACTVLQERDLRLLQAACLLEPHNEYNTE